MKDLPKFPFWMAQGKSLFMPLRVLLTGKLHGPDIGASVLLIHKAGTSGVVSPQAGFATMDERIKMLKDLEWEALNKDEPILEPAATAASSN